MEQANEIAEASTRTDVLLQVDELCIAYPHRSGVRAAVDKLSFTIRRGEAFGLVGESGSGKSSVAMAILGYLHRNTQTSGTVQFEGRDLATLSRKALRALRGDRIAAVYQHPGAALNPALTIGRQIVETLRTHRPISSTDARDRAIELFARMRLPNPHALFDRYPHELSGGMQQRATIAMAISLEPALLVLDEPTTALDANVQTEIVAILDELRREYQTALLLISHDIDLIRRTTERVGVMRNGVLVEQGETQRLIAEPSHAYTRSLIASIPRGGFTRRDGRLGIESGANEIRVHAASTYDAAAPRTALRCTGIRHVYGAHTVLHNIDLEIAAGETFGLIGESGSGKSTLAKVVSGLVKPTSGTVELFGAAVAARSEARLPDERRALQMVFQSPDMTLNPRHRIGRILAQPLRKLARVPRKGIGLRIDNLLSSVQLPAEYQLQLPNALSGGQRQRVAIARAFAGAPDLVVLDEPTSALDVSVQATILNLLSDFQRERGTSYLLISHDLNVVRYMADQVGVIYRGQIVEAGPAERIFSGPNHPYTRSLLTSARYENASRSQGIQQRGCVFADRCPFADSRCQRESPPARRDDSGHMFLCWREPHELASTFAARSVDERVERSVRGGIARSDSF